MQHRTIPHTLKLVPLALALGLAIALPAQADPAGPNCWTFDTTAQAWVQDATIDKTQGAEHGNRNSTCLADANAYGTLNNASGGQSSERSEEHTCELQSLMRIPSAGLSLKNKTSLHT